MSNNLNMENTKKTLLQSKLSDGTIVKVHPFVTKIILFDEKKD